MSAPAYIDYQKTDPATMRSHWQAQADKNKDAEVFFTSLREELQAQMNQLIQDYRDLDMNAIVTTVQADAFAFRTRLVAEITTTLSRLSIRQKGVKKITGDRREFYTTNYGIKHAMPAIKECMDRDLSEQQANLEIMQVHIDFLRDYVKQCDNLGYAIRNRIDLARAAYSQQ